MPLLSWQELGVLVEGGLVLGSHTRQHFDLRAISDVQLLDEIAGASMRIANETGSNGHSIADQCPSAAVSVSARNNTQPNSTTGRQ